MTFIWIVRTRTCCQVIKLFLASLRIRTKREVRKDSETILLVMLWLGHCHRCSNHRHESALATSLLGSNSIVIEFSRFKFSGSVSIVICICSLRSKGRLDYHLFIMLTVPPLFFFSGSVKIVNCDAFQIFIRQCFTWINKYFGIFFNPPCSSPHDHLRPQAYNVSWPRMIWKILRDV